MKEISINSEWKEALRDFLATPEFAKLRGIVREEYQTKKIFPKPKDMFAAFDKTPFPKVRVVILGQDPYHGDGQAHGLSFSVPKGVPLPPSLQNIYKEIKSDLGIKKDFTNGNLEAWAEQGVFLLNAVLSVVAHSPASHKGVGWEAFTDEVIRQVSNKREHVVFMLWGNFARSKKHLIDTTKHLVLEAPHPSPFSAHSGFFGSKHFSACNAYLVRHGKEPISW